MPGKTHSPRKQLQLRPIAASVAPGPFSHFLPKSITEPVAPTPTSKKPTKERSPNPKKRKRAEIPQWREYSKRSRKQISYADPEQSDDSAFYDSDDDSEEIIAQKKAKVDRPLPKRHTFPFLSLPRELRDMIYEYAVGSPTIERLDDDDSNNNKNERSPQDTHHISKVVFITEGEHNYRRRAMRYSRHRLGKHWNAAPIATALLRANRQIHAEAAPVLYGANRFCFSDPHALHAFVAGLTRPTRALLRKVHVLYWFPRRSSCRAYNHSAFFIMAEGCVGVQEFKFDAGTYERIPKWEARRIYRWAHQWLDVLVAAKDGGVAEVLGVLAKGVERWGKDWRVGGEKWDAFSRELVRLIALRMGEEGEENEQEQEEEEPEEDECMG